MFEQFQYSSLVALTNCLKIDEKTQPLDSQKLYVGFQDPEHISMNSRGNAPKIALPMQNMSQIYNTIDQLRIFGFTEQQIRAAVNSGNAYTPEMAIDYITKLSI